MFFIFKRKKIVLSIAVIMVMCAVLINFGIIYKNDEAVSVVSDMETGDLPELGDAVLVSASSDKMSDVRSDKENMRSKACELLCESIENPKISEEAKSEAEQKLLDIADNIDDEASCESMLAIKGYENSVVFISDDVVTVSVDANDLKGEDIARINDVIFSQTGNNNIKIVEVK